MKKIISTILILSLISCVPKKKVQIKPTLPPLPTSYEELKEFFTKEAYRINDIKMKGEVDCTLTLFHPALLATYRPSDTPSTLDRVCERLIEEEEYKDYTIVGALLRAKREEDLDISVWHFLLCIDTTMHEPEQIIEESVEEDAKYLLLCFPPVTSFEECTIRVKALGLLDHFEACWQFPKKIVKKEVKEVKKVIEKKVEEEEVPLWEEREEGWGW